VASAILLRPAEDSDLPGMAELWVRTWADTLPQIDFGARTPWFVERISAARRAGVRVEVAERDGVLAGFVTVDPATGHLDQLAVASALRGSGVAKAILDHAKAIAPGFLHLEANAANPRAIRFYEREGFRRTGEGVSAASGLPLFHYAWSA
jgi:putative acetyltransferase